MLSRLMLGLESLNLFGVDIYGFCLSGIYSAFFVFGNVTETGPSIAEYVTSRLSLVS